MNNNNRRGADDIDAAFAALRQQVDGLKENYRDLQVGMVNLNTKIDASFTSLSTKIDSRNVTPWSQIWAALGVGLAGLTTVGWLALQPTRDAVFRLDQTVNTEADRRRSEDIMTSNRVLLLERMIARADGAREQEKLDATRGAIK